MISEIINTSIICRTNVSKVVLIIDLGLLFDLNGLKEEFKKKKPY